MPDWNDFKYFLAIEKAGTLAGAARALSCEHSTVSRRLAQLEESLGAKLFTRTPDGFALTEAGAAIAPLAHELERAAEAIERKARGADSKVEGVVRVTCSEAFTAFLVKRLPELMAKHPALIPEILSGNERLDLTRREADLALRIAPTDQPDLLCKKVGSAGWSLYAAPAYVARKGKLSSAQKLEGHELVGYDAAMSRVPGAVFLDAHGAGATIVFRGNSILSALNAAIGGLGICSVPCFLGEPESGLVRLTDEVIGSRDIFLIVHPDLAQTARVRAVMDFAQDVFNREARVLSGR